MGNNQYGKLGLKNIEESMIVTTPKLVDYLSKQEVV
jgi:hypothetical protein